MKFSYKLLSFLMSIVLLASNITIPVQAMEVEPGVSTHEVSTYQSDIIVNPLYADVVDPDELKAELEAIESASEITTSSIEKASTYQSKEEVIAYVRRQMVARVESIAVSVTQAVVESSDDIWDEIFSAAMTHTEACSGQEGDALQWGWRGASRGYRGSNGIYDLTFNISYYTNAAQENELTTKVNSIMASLALNGKSEYDKIKAIHDYICDNTNYDYTYKKYSAYDALCTGTSVCQGYAIAFYRLCKEAGLSVRIITGIGSGEDHAWNIVKIGDEYYNVDCTWDGQDDATRHSWFLLNEIDFVDHVRGAEYDTPEFHVVYPMAEYSYGDEETVFMNKDNVEATFTTIDEETVSSSAEGRPKVLIFYMSTWSNCDSTIQSIAEYGLTGVDIYAINAGSDEKETVQEFKNAYGNDSIVFTYATDNSCWDLMWSYVRAVYGTTNGISVSLPLIIYIDADNKIQFLTMGTSNGRQVEANVNRYCQGDENGSGSGENPNPGEDPNPDPGPVTERTITYVLDGGINHADNPATYNKNTDTIVLMDPTKEGYVFLGWYTDEAFTEKITQIEKGTDKDITLYALFAKELELQIPATTTYLIGEEIDLSGGSVIYGPTGETIELTDSMISGFSTEQEGICTVEVTYKEYTATFEVLVVAKPQMKAYYGQTLSELVLPSSEYGTYSWIDEATSLDKVGEQTYPLMYVPNDLKYTIRGDLQANVEVYRVINEETMVTLTPNEYTYNGRAQKPNVTVAFVEEELPAENYTIRYENNVNAGTATVTVTGQGYYEGSKSVEFTIKPAKLTITAKDMTIPMGQELPEMAEYEVKGLVQGESLIKEPTFTYGISDTTVAGVYDIVPSNAIATNNYDANITYINGKLTIAEEKVGYTVSFDVQGHGVAPADYVGVKAGNIIAEPEAPMEEGYTFNGWYKDAACTKVWDFENDTVQENTILYAKWSVNNPDTEFELREIPDAYYTGKAIKPAVEVYDGDVLLKLNKDYKVTYKNNTNVNATLKGGEFDENLPHIIITGKGNYTDVIKVNFNILPAEIGDGGETPASGVTLKYSDQLVANEKKAQNVFSSIKLGRSMKKDVDFTVSVEAVNAVDGVGNPIIGEMPDAKIPAGYSGSFQLVINGIGNYTGSIVKEVVVTDKAYLMKNATISIGKNLKNVDYEYYTDELNTELPAGYYDSITKKYYSAEDGEVYYDSIVDVKDVFTVKSGKNYLIYKKDFEVTYQNISKPGTATMVITGIGNYSGTKSVPFKLTGKAFNAKTVVVNGIKEQKYTGKPLTQNSVELTYKDGAELEYGKDYTIKYDKHINKGKATMTFIAADDSGYQGSFKKTFNILPASVKTVSQDESMGSISVEYDKSGVKPADKVILTYNGKELVSGKDYTISYRNNKNVADKGEEKAPTIIVKGKGNYNDTLEVPFTITKADLGGEKIAVTVKEMAYNSKKVAGYEYKPSVTVKDGKKTLSRNKDYTVTYEYNTQKDYEEYKGGNGTKMPRIIIDACENGNYELVNPIEIELPVYQTKLTNKNLRVEIEPAVYTGSQVKPKVTVYYLDKELGEIPLEGTDYELEYGTNVTAGKNKGTVKIKGISPEYGGSVTYKFNIGSKKIKW